MPEHHLASQMIQFGKYWKVSVSLLQDSRLLSVFNQTLKFIRAAAHHTGVSLDRSPFKTGHEQTAEPLKKCFTLFKPSTVI